MTRYYITQKTIQPDITTYELALLVLCQHNPFNNISKLVEEYPELVRHLDVREDVSPSKFETLFNQVLKPGNYQPDVNIFKK